MAILTKKMIFQRSTTFFAHFAIFIFLISFFSFSHFTTACLTFCPLVQKSIVGGLLRENPDAAPQNFSKSNIFSFRSPGLERFGQEYKTTLFQKSLASKNQLPTFEKKQLNKNTI